MAGVKILTLVETLTAAGAERVAVNLAVALKRSTAFCPVVCASRSGGELETLLKEHQVEYRVLGRKSSRDVAPWSVLTRWIRDEQIALVHGHMRGSNLWAGVLGRLCGVPVVAHAHGEPTGPVDLAFSSAIATLVDRVIAVSENERQNLLRAPLVSAAGVVTIHNGLDPAVYTGPREPALKQELGFPPDSQVVGICAKLRAEKSHEIFLRAARDVATRHREAHFLVLGDGPRRGELEAIARELGLGDRCRFAGHRTDVPQLLRCMDVGVLTSDREGLPLAILEYMASGLPLVSTRVGGIPEAIRDGENGFLLEAGDVGSIAERVSRLLDDSTLRENMAARGERIFNDEFSEAAMVKKVGVVYRELLK